MSTRDSLGISVRLDAELQRFEDQMERAGRVVETSTTNMDRATRRVEQRFSRLEGALDPAARALQRYERDSRTVKQALDRGAVSAERAANVQRRLNDQYEAAVARLNQVDRAQERATTTTVTATTRTSRFGNAAQNASFQIGDLATQIASGQSATRALAQQLPQLLGGFGVLGAVAGAAAAVLGGLATAFTNSADAADKAAESNERLAETQRFLNDALRVSIEETGGLAQEFANLNEQQRELERIGIDSAIRRTQAAMQSLRLDISNAVTPLEQFREQIENQIDLFERFNPGEELPQRVQNFQQLFQAIDEFRSGGSVVELVTQLDEFTKELDENSEVSQEVVDRALVLAQRFLDQQERAERLQDRLESVNATKRDTAAASERAADALAEENRILIAQTEGYDDLFIRKQMVADQNRDLLTQRLDEQFERERQQAEALQRQMEEAAESFERQVAETGQGVGESFTEELLS